MPDFDLDEASDILTWELAEQTTSPGAHTAIRQSHRRRATIGAATAAALVAIGGVVLSLTQGDDQVLPAGPDKTLPDPAPLDATALDAATSGWINGWRAPKDADGPALEGLNQEIACLGSMYEVDSLPEPARSGGDLLVTDGQQIGFMVFADFAGQAQDAEGRPSAATSPSARARAGR